MKNNYKPLIVAVFLVGVGLIMRNSNGSTEVTVTAEATAGTQHSVALIGVAQAQAEGVEVTDSAALIQNGGVAMDGVANVPGDSVATSPALSLASPPSAYAIAAVQDPGQPIGQAIDPSQVLQYTVKKGDTLSGVAAHLHVSAATILSANPNIRKKSLQVGAVITIPGGGANGANSTGGMSANSTQGAALSVPSLPSFKGDFILPAQGYDYGILDANNGVNIVNSCGTPVVAAADGIVVPDANISDSLGGWNNGYGNFVLLEHAFGNDIFTRYAHLERPLVQIGSFVKQGQEIGLIGQTGGVSACELDFEVIGAQNPFAK